MDISGEDAEVQAVANAVWTDSVKAAWKLYGEEYNPLYKSISNCNLNDYGKTKTINTNQGGDDDDTFEG